MAMQAVYSDDTVREDTFSLGSADRRLSLGRLLEVYFDGWIRFMDHLQPVKAGVIHPV